MENGLNKGILNGQNSSRILGAPIANGSEDVFVSIAILGMIATIADGVALTSEIDQFTQVFEKRFSLSRPEALKIIGIAVNTMQQAEPEEMIDVTCDNLNVNFSCEQKMTVFEGLADVIVADGIVQESEEHFMDVIAQKLRLEDAINKKYPLNHNEG